MASLNTYFRDFLQDIRPTERQRSDMKSGHETLRRRLQGFEGLQDVLVSDFIQGSYRRSTAVRPLGDRRSDVDVIVVTNLDSELVEPDAALKRFLPFLREYYEGKYKFQGRSIAIELSYVDLDLVVTAAPSEMDQSALRSAAIRSMSTPEEVDDWRLNAYWVPLEERNSPGAYSRLLKAAAEAEWKTEPLLIPDRDAQRWEKTHPLAQIDWTFKKNKATGGHYVNVVKALKWWRVDQHPRPKHPKGYPLEHMIGDCCPDEIESVAEGVTLTLESIRDDFQDEVERGEVPTLWDRGVRQPVLKRLAVGDFADFHGQATDAAGLARQALEESDRRESARLWRELFGSKFPEPPKTGGGNSGSGSRQAGYTEPIRPSIPSRGRFGRSA